MPFICEICAYSKRVTTMFRIKDCDHLYCSDCIAKYVASKIEENIIHIKCPATNCSGVIDLQSCCKILPLQVLDRWGDALCEATILDSEKFYCPFKDCSALLIDDGLHCEEVMKNSTKKKNEKEVMMQYAECPYCWRLFCVQCKVPWHADIDCEEFQKLNVDEREREDIMLLKLAKTNKWMRCNMCKFYVDRTDGCLFMKCRCGYTFCYNCGAPLKEHFCTVCKH